MVLRNRGMDRNGPFQYQTKRRVNTDHRTRALAKRPCARRDSFSDMTTPTVSPKPLRILQMCAVDFTARQFLLPLALALRDQGHRVDFSFAPGPYSSEIEAMGFRVHANPVARNLNVLRHAAATWRTWRLLRREGYDVVHVHTPIAALVGRLAARLAGVPVKIYTAHGFYFHDEMPPGKRALFVLLEKIGAACGDFIMTVSREDAQAAVELGIARPEQVEVIYNGVDTTHFDPDRFPAAERLRKRAELGIPANAPVVGIVGRFVREKGHFELLHAMRTVADRLSEARLLVVGDVLPSDRDGIRTEFIRKAEELGLADRIILSGLVSDTAPWLALMDLFALPSYREGMPVSLLEAMAMALPAVATDIRGCREEVVEGETGWLVPARNSEELAQRLLRLLEAPDRARAMGETARKRVLHIFDLQRVVEHQLVIYSKLLSPR